jgi:tetratricopeptide (TPR) repeat protein
MAEGAKSLGVFKYSLYVTHTILKNRNYNLLRKTLLSLFVLWVVVSVLLSSYPSISIVALGASSSTTITSDAGLNQVTILNNKGMSLYNSGRFNESNAYFDKALVIDPKNVVTLDNKGLALLSVSINNYTQAITYFDKALSIEPKNVAALFHKANALAGLGNYTQAITYYDRVLTIDPKNVAALDNRGVAFYHLGNYTKAITYYDKALAKQCCCTN